MHWASMSSEIKDFNYIVPGNSTEDSSNNKETMNNFAWHQAYSPNSGDSCLIPNPSRRQISPFNNYSLRSSSSESDYWAFQPLHRSNLLPPDKTTVTSSYGRGGRSISFSDPPPAIMSSAGPGGYYRSSSPLLFRDRMYSVPSLHHTTTKEFDFPLVDDIFPTVPSPTSPVDRVITTTRSHLTDVMKLGDISVIGKKKDPGLSCGGRSAGWLEDSIDSSMLSAAHSGLCKDSLSLSELQTVLPSSSLLPKCTNVPSPTINSMAAGGTATAGVLGGSCLLKKLMPTLSDETYSRKVFIGGLPPDIDQEEIRMSFQKYGAVTIDWPHKIYSKSRVPPKGYAFLLFKDEGSVHKLLACCVSENDKLFSFIKYYVSGTTITRKKCQIRPWKISESYYFANEDKKVDSRKAVFVGGVPRPLKAYELAEVMTDKFGPVSFVAIDCDADLKYPKGAACVVFATHASYIAAVSSRFMQLVFGSLEKKVEVKPYILEDQLCDECNGIQSDGQPAPFFCGSVTCLKYYCEHCWATYHSLSGRQNHRPMFKDIFDRDKFT